LRSARAWLITGGSAVLMAPDTAFSISSLRSPLNTERKKLKIQPPVPCTLMSKCEKEQESDSMAMVGLPVGPPVMDKSIEIEPPTPPAVTELWP